MHTISTGLNPKNFDVIAYKNSGELTINQANKFYAFSKESNTLVIILDMFQGNIFADIIDKNPRMLKQFSGFTYYPNTLSHGSSTWKSISSIAGGYDFQMQFMTETNDDLIPSSSDHKLAYNSKEKAYLKNMEIAQLYSHDYSIFKPSYVDCNIFNSYQKSICSNDVIIKEELLNLNSLIAAID